MTVLKQIKAAAVLLRQSNKYQQNPIFNTNWVR